MSHAPLTGDHKANFDSIYDRPDPRAYFATLGPLDYQIPQNALPVIRRVLAAAGADRPVLDVCCSYGINGALLRHDLDLADLASHYADADPDADAQQLAAGDRAFFAAHARDPRPVVYGLDAAPHAVDYACRTGLLDAGWVEDLERDDPSSALVDGVRDVGLITCTGGVGYVGAPTFRRLVAATARPEQLSLAVFVLREFSYDDIASALEEFGLVTEQVTDRTFVQRRFASDDEQEAALSDVRARGLDPTGKEADGWFHATCYVTRPARAAAHTPLAELVG